MEASCSETGELGCYLRLSSCWISAVLEYVAKKMGMPNEVKTVELPRYESKTTAIVSISDRYKAGDSLGSQRSDVYA
jgi:hypothetical protein